MARVRDLLRVAVRAAEERKARDVSTLDLRGLSSVTDYFVLCSGTSDTHVRAIADFVSEELKRKGQRPFSLEGYREGTWVLLDYVDFVVHVFHQEQRVFYGIEELWADAKQVAFRAPAAKKGASRKAPERKAAAGPAVARKKAPAKRAGTATPPAARGRRTARRG